VLFCVRALQRHYASATELTPREQAVHAQRVIAMLELDLAAMNVGKAIRDGLHEYNDGLRRQFINIDHALTDHVFHALPDAN
jgi:hypothetical protein